MQTICLIQWRCHGQAEAAGGASQPAGGGGPAGEGEDLLVGQVGESLGHGWAFGILILRHDSPRHETTGRRDEIRASANYHPGG